MLLSENYVIIHVKCLKPVIEIYSEAFSAAMLLLRSRSVIVVNSFFFLITLFASCHFIRLLRYFLFLLLHRSF